MPSREDHLEAAKLAKLVGSQLNLIDNFHTDRKNIPANRIDINKFIAQVTDPSGRQYVNNSSGYVPEELVQKMVPDIVPQNQPMEQLVVNDPIIQTQPIIQTEVPRQIQEPKQEFKVSSIMEENHALNKIADSLESIAESYSKYVDYITGSSTIDDKSKQTVLNE